jgi:negative regulator of flagellin synthesis FlgM
MRIDAFSSAASQLSNDLSAQPVGTQATASAKSHGATDDDRTTLSSDMTSVASLVSEAMASPEVRQGRVDNLRQAMSNGEYNVDPQSIAAAMVEES